MIASAPWCRTGVPGVGPRGLEPRKAWLLRYGGKISSEWFYSKALQILDEDPDLYHGADRLIEAADWVVWQLTGAETRNNCTAGYKAIWSKQDGLPPNAYFAALDPRFERVVDEKMSRRISFVGERAGGLTERAAGWTGLTEGTAVAVANVDAHVSVPAATVTGPGDDGRHYGHKHLPHGPRGAHRDRRGQVRGGGGRNRARVVRIRGGAICRETGFRPGTTARSHPDRSSIHLLARWRPWP